MKKNAFKNLPRFVFLTVCILLCSCGRDEECRLDKYVQLYAGFYQIHTDTITGIITERQLSIDSLTIQGTGVDSFLYRNARNLNAVKLPLNPIEGTSSFSFKFNEIEDEVHLSHINHEDYLSFECGILVTFTLDLENSRHTQHYIDSIVVRSLEVNTSNAENIKIYHSPKQL